VTTSANLRGRTIFLSASVPRRERAREFATREKAGEIQEPFSRIDFAPFEIEQAVISLARAVFAANGRLVFGGHPSISPLVATVAGEYREAFVAEGGKERQRAPVLIYQSRAFEEHAPEANLLMFKSGVAEVVWVESENDERFVLGAGIFEEPCPASLKKMRTRMLRESEPLAMVCIGGMAGVVKEVALFSEQFPDKSVFVLASTGGAAAMLSRTRQARVRDADRDALSRPADDGAISKATEGSTGPPVMPYPFIMQTIVDELAEAL
jgi:hypothetical protein